MSMRPAGYAVQNISKHVWKLPGDSNIYYLDLGAKVIIDTSERPQRAKMDLFLSKFVDFSKIDLVIFTHFHLDHVGNFDAFPNARLVASRAEIEDFRKDVYGAVLDKNLAEKFKHANLVAIEDIQLPRGLEVIPSPGHTRGSICIWYPAEKILFSGDTLFPVGIGRTDLPTSVPDEMPKTLAKLTQYNFKTLCAGHDYGLEQL
ncbi:MBL fold metallo-hydrolase [Candidatus Woesearchaeota archaeon]|nr:MBL fold metallo-hydrolase [Candidatus Woesearchaeota archaeon]